MQRRKSLIEDARNHETFDEDKHLNQKYFAELNFRILEDDQDKLQTLVEYLEIQAISSSILQQPQKNGSTLREKECHVTCTGNTQLHNNLLRKLEDLKISTTNINQTRLPDIWFPTKIADLDRCQYINCDVDAHTDSSHPGFNDPEYLIRRNEISSNARDFKQGKPLPTVDYIDSETETWTTVYNELKNYHGKYACRLYNKVFKILEDKEIIKPTSIPQLQHVSEFMKEMSGFQLRPVAGLLSARDFLASLAFKVFQCTQYIRHPSAPMHTPEPDLIHEILGHVPMLCDPQFAVFSQEVGLASLGATDKNIEELSTLYWFTVEFGLCLEDGEKKAYGAGLLSAFGELEHSVSDTPKHLPLDAEITSTYPYEDVAYQSTYFVSSSFEDALMQVRNFSEKNISRNFTVTYNEEIQAMKVTQKPIKNIK